MKSHKLHSVVFAGLLLIGTAALATAQTQGGDPHHPAQTQAEPAAPGQAPAAAAPGEGPAAGAPEGMPGMMTPQMMQMMQNMMGQGGMGGMMGGMSGQGMARGGMGQGTMMCPMMQMMMGARGGMGMPGMMGGPGMMLGMPRGSQEEMTPERVRTFMEEHLTRQGNPRLKLGEVATAADGSITAEIVTVDGSLVQKLAFNRYPGLFRQVQ